MGAEYLLCTGSRPPPFCPYVSTPTPYPVSFDRNFCNFKAPNQNLHPFTLVWDMYSFFESLQQMCRTWKGWLRHIFNFVSFDHLSQSHMQRNSLLCPLKSVPNQQGDCKWLICDFFQDKDAGKFTMTITGGSGSDSYAAVAFSQKQAMEDGDLYYCTSSKLQSAAILGKSRPTDTNNNVSILEFAVASTLGSSRFVKVL